MSKKPTLPGAADFFAVGDTLPAPESPPIEPLPAADPAPLRETTQPVRPRKPAGQVAALDPPAPTPGPSAADLAPPATVPTGPTEKVTFYLHPLSLRRLELLRAQMLVERNLKVNRSQIIDLLLEEALQQPEPLTEKLLALAEPAGEQ